MLPRLGGFGTVGIAFEDLSPSGAVVGKLLCRPIEKKGDAFAVVLIEAVFVQMVPNSVTVRICCDIPAS